MEELIFIISSLAKCGAVIGFTLTMVAYSVVAERRFSAFIQDRVGPNRVGIPLTDIRLSGLLQPVADGLKFLLKEEFTPAHVHKFYFWLAPALAMVPALLTVAVVPFGHTIDLRAVILLFENNEWVSHMFATLAAQDLNPLNLFIFPAVIADIDVGILFVFAIVSIGVYGIVLAGWASNSKYPFLGGIRSSAQMISYELSMGLAVVPVFLIIGHLNLSKIVEYQIDHGWLAFPIFGGYDEWQMYLLWIPLALSFLIFLISAFAETNRLPFDMPECETELVGGYHTEYSSMKFALFFLGEYAAMIVVSCIMVTVFLGGWSLPLPWFDGNVPEDTALGLWLPFLMSFAHIGVFVAKVALFIFFFIQVRWTLPRFRYDQLMGLGWKVFIPLGLANVLVTAFILGLIHAQ